MQPGRRPLASHTVLIVDDQAPIRNLLTMALSEAGAVVATADDGRTALQQVRARPPELILLDLAMPDVDGWHVLEGLQADPSTARIPVVLQTSSEDLASYARALVPGKSIDLPGVFLGVFAGDWDDMGNAAMVVASKVMGGGLSS